MSDQSTFSHHSPDEVPINQYQDSEIDTIPSASSEVQKIIEKQINKIFENSEMEK